MRDDGMAQGSHAHVARHGGNRCDGNAGGDPSYATDQLAAVTARDVAKGVPAHGCFPQMVRDCNGSRQAHKARRPAQTSRGPPGHRVSALVVTPALRLDPTFGWGRFATCYFFFP